MTGESRHKASSLYTTTCGYVEQTQSKMGTMTTRHMIGSSVARGWRTREHVAMDREDEVQSHKNRNQFKCETEKHKDETRTRHKTGANQKQEAKHMRRPWQSKEVGCRLGPLHGGTAYRCSVQLPYGVSNTKHEVQDKTERNKDQKGSKTKRKKKKYALIGSSHTSQGGEW